MIVLIGFMGAGKTTVGRLIATKVGLPFVDTDELIAARASMSIVEIFRMHGEPHFRELEREVVLETLGGPNAVVSLGGGSLGDPAVATAMQGKDVVMLEVSYTEARRRLRGDDSRPVLHGGDPRALFEEREQIYARLAKRTVATDHRSPTDIALEVAAAVKGVALGQEQLQRVILSLAERSYEVIVGRDLLSRLAEFLPSVEDAEKAFVVSHPSLERLTKEVETSLIERKLAIHHLRIAEGENSKSLEVATRLWSELARAGAHRGDLVLAVGGGVVSDVAGFVAATYNRGMPLIQVPTTLLGQVDAAIGGKSGVNIPEGKNLIGSIHQPAAVVCDVDTLASLPEEEFRSGMAEVIKYGLIADPDLLEGLAETYRRVYDGHTGALINLVSRSAAVKASFVVADESDRGNRRFLNYGHTFGHAIERIHGFSGIRHGEAVALGMMAAAYLSNEVGRLDQYGLDAHRSSLTAVGLPISAQLELDVLEAAWRHDKKYRHGVRFVLLDSIGSPRADVEADRGAIGAALGRLAE